MKQPLPFSDIRSATGMIIPVWYPDSTTSDEMESLLTACVADAGVFAEPQHILLVIDGSESALSAARKLQAKRGCFEILAQETNTGKGGAVAAGIANLLSNPSVKYMVTRDHDNDHLAQDTPNLVRLAERMTRALDTELVAVIGRRSSVQRHLGFTRGEFEWFMNEAAYHAACFALAAQGRVPNTQFTAAYDHVPDMQTGFKCYTRAAAELFIKIINSANAITPGLDIQRHGAEIPILIELLMAGGALGEVNRLAYEHQPLTTYDTAGRITVNGTVLTWSFQRTNIPLPAIRQILLNAMARRLLGKEEAGCRALIDLANWTLSNLAQLRGQAIPPMAAPALADYF